MILHSMKHHHCFIVLDHMHAKTGMETGQQTGRNAKTVKQRNSDQHFILPAPLHMLAGFQGTVDQIVMTQHNALGHCSGS